jgi:MFS family permease
VKRFFVTFKENPVWIKILLFSLILFFIRLSDAIISFWAPNQIQNALGNPVIMGAIVSFQSVVGLLADLVFPRLLKSIKVRQLVFWAILTSALTSFFLTTSTIAPFIAVFIVTMALWGIYYELVNFANFQFMGSVVPLHMRAAAWGFTGIFLNLAYFLGPFIASQLLQHGIFLTQGVIVVFLVTALLLLTLTKNIHDAPSQVDFFHLNPLVEFKHWLTLSEYIWPILVISLVLGFIDSTFWTVGAVWAEKLTKINPWGVWFLLFYLLPSICLGIPLSGWRIYQGKKKMAEKFLGLSGILLIGMAISSSVSWQLAIVCLSSTALAFTYPLVDAVYSDIIARMGQERKDMIGLTSSVINISYIIWPIFAGLIASRVGERLTFSWLGVGVVVVALILLLVTPKKLKLPQTEIKRWVTQDQ